MAEGHSLRSLAVVPYQLSCQVFNWPQAQTSDLHFSSLGFLQLVKASTLISIREDVFNLMFLPYRIQENASFVLSYEFAEIPNG